MDVRITMSLSDLLIINFRKPVVSSNRTGVTQNKSSYGVSNCRVFLHSPVFYLYIAVYYIFIIQNSGFHGTHFFTLLTVQNICLGSLCVSGLLQYLLYTVLNILYMNTVILYLALKVCSHTKSQKIHHVIIVLYIRSVKCLNNSITDLGQCKVRYFSFSFDYLKHPKNLHFSKNKLPNSISAPNKRKRPLIKSVSSEV